MSSSKIKHKLPLEILEELATNQKPTIVMSEGSEPRIITGAAAAFDTGMCQIVLLGIEIIIKTECKICIVSYTLLVFIKLFNNLNCIHNTWSFTIIRWSY